MATVEEQTAEVLGTLKVTEHLFKLWWELYGQHFEEKWGFSVTKREISAYAFEAGYLAGRRNHAQANLGRR